MSGFIRWIGTLREQSDQHRIDFSESRPAENFQLDKEASGVRSTNLKGQLAEPSSVVSKADELEDEVGSVAQIDDAEQLAVVTSAPSQSCYWRFELGRSCRVMAQALGLNRLQNYLQGTCTELLPHEPVWILGVEYSPRELSNTGDDGQPCAHEEAMEDFKSRLWFTYRCGFEPIGTTSLTSDVGWGCTLRTGQMLIAEGLMRHTLGRGWRRQSAAVVLGAGTPPEIMQLLRLMHDTAAHSAPLSVHNLCSAQAVSGVQPGEWLGPWVLCHALQAAVMTARPFGIALHVLAEPGGGAPVLYKSTLLKTYFPSSVAAHNGNMESPPAAAAREGQQEEDRSAAAVANGDTGAASDVIPGCARAASALILLLPLTLGIGKVNPRYIPQLQTVLMWPQSIGIVGGRPGSSLAFIGCQEDTIVFLDPHETQQVVADAEVGHSATYHCSTVRTMPVVNIDPSLAIGFYCRSSEALQELCSQLRDLEVKSGGAPLVGIVDGFAPPSSSWRHVSNFDSSDEDSSGADGGNGHGGEWEIL